MWEIIKSDVRGTLFCRSLSYTSTLQGCWAAKVVDHTTEPLLLSRHKTSFSWNFVRHTTSWNKISSKQYKFNIVFFFSWSWSLTQGGKMDRDLIQLLFEVNNEHFRYIFCRILMWIFFHKQQLPDLVQSESTHHYVDIGGAPDQSSVGAVIFGRF